MQLDVIQMYKEFAFWADRIEQDVVGFIKPERRITLSLEGNSSFRCPTHINIKECPFPLLWASR
jgi:hypothetical protein